MRTTTSTLRNTLTAAFLAGSVLIGTGAYAAAADEPSPAAAAARSVAQRDASAAPTAQLTQLYRPRFTEPLATR